MGRVIHHDIVEAREESSEVAVAVAALVGAAVVAQERGWSIAGHCAFSNPRDRRGVVTAVGKGGVADVMRGGHEGHLAEQASLLQVTVGDSAGEVVCGDEPVLDVFWKRETPHDGASSGVEVDAAHAHLGGISCAEE